MCTVAAAPIVKETAPALTIRHGLGLTFSACLVGIREIRGPSPRYAQRQAAPAFTSELSLLNQTTECSGSPTVAFSPNGSAVPSNRQRREGFLLDRRYREIPRLLALGTHVRHCARARDCGRSDSLMTALMRAPTFVPVHPRACTEGPPHEN